ncbi:MAG: VWA domain-containing protein [Blastocatellia bacterium]|nr:VWA domain-containing protein [Blastocatellia bacterium]
MMTRFTISTPLILGIVILGLLAPMPYTTEASPGASLSPQAGRRSEPRPRPKNESEQQKPEQRDVPIDQTAPKPKPGQEEPVVQLGAELVSVPVVVFDKKKGILYTGLKKENFAIYEDNVKQEIVTFASAEAPLTMVILIEYSKIIQWIREEVIYPAGLFVSRFVKPGDYVAIVAYDIRPKVLNDFTGNVNELMESVHLLIRNWPAFSEANLFDALKFVLDGGTVDGETYRGLAEIEGRTCVLLIATGYDTFSRINFDEARRIVSNAGVPIYSIGVGEVAYIRAEPYLSGPARLDFLQAQNQLRTFSESTGGRFYSVRFPGELPTVLESITTMIRNQYVLGYTPSNPRREGKRRRIKVLVDVDGDGREDNKNLEVQYRTTYTEPKEVKK